MCTDESMRKVLIVEDNADLRAIFSFAFNRRYFIVDVATDGVEALDYLNRERPDIVILDINMPRLSGYDVLRHVRANPQTQDIKIVVVTGNIMALQAPEAEFADMLLIKPVNINDLLTLAQRLMPTE